MRYWPTMILCLGVWATVVWARTTPGNEMTLQHFFAIAVVAVCCLTIGIVVERVLPEGEKS